MPLLQLKPLLKNLLLASGLVLSACNSPPTTESYDAMPIDLADAKPIIDLGAVANITNALRAKRVAEAQPADTSDPSALPSYVIAGPKGITWETVNNACHGQGRKLPRQPIDGLENLRYFLENGSFVRMGNVVGEADAGGNMIGWVVCEP
jgi:hypothetical protein